VASILKRIGDLDINQDLAFQRRSWSLQRIGWGLIALVLIAALLGLFGHGPLSEATTDDPSLPIRLAYERFGRFGSPLVLRIRVEPAAAIARQVILDFCASNFGQKAIRLAAETLRGLAAIVQIQPRRA